MSTNYVLVLDTNRKPLNPCKPGMARSLLKAGKAAVFKQYPFTIILNKAVDDAPKPVQLKIDPGSKVTGLALVQDDKVLWGAELYHRGQQIKADLEDRRKLRRGRRNRKTRYRQPRFLNRTRPEGWLAPSMLHRVLTTMTWVRRLTKFVPVTGISLERVRFDMQKMINPEVSGVDYQQGELQGYEVREYLLEKWNRQCAYCQATDTRLEVDHIHPKSKGGSDRVSNLTVACHDCNQAKGNRNITDFLSGKSDLLNRILSQVKQPLLDAAAVNSTRNKIAEELIARGLPIEFGTGGQTKYNRCRLDLPKTHWLDAACVGVVVHLTLETKQCLTITASGHGNRQMAGVDKYGFPYRHRTRQQVHFGFRSGDIVRAVVPKGKKAGTHLGRVLCRKSGSFDIQTKSGRVTGINHKYCSTIHGRDGYAYVF
ncbi:MULTISPECIES: RNA-guided endonuclease IscB [Moorena]|uniref:Restriction endonuclease n=1 Tax=Moorena producens 3L TaxID=489825 RepID=F4XVB1_9CYAN|nr:MULTISPECIES: RNA-guided endonuclease IscB [Moorena]NES86962.1 HNH endonuclease [Moorena sp. SIO2B7]EGJ31459.1 restriction endonuclease [Moorena producens 3L]NEP37200.1 HNH endonuclease [Moorena sp. SIO3B2]NEP65833.1 HNH endonuclease [Moorena sp. SIO3A5]OLT68727.1 HNH endonuclease [Moorena producens 3L]